MPGPQSVSTKYVVHVCDIEAKHRNYCDNTHYCLHLYILTCINIHSRTKFSHLFITTTKIYSNIDFSAVTVRVCHFFYFERFIRRRCQRPHR